MENLIFTNSALIRAIQCKKSYYLNQHFPELRDEVTENQQSIFERRKIIAKLTNHLFPKGKYAGIDVTGSCEMSYLHTKDLLDSDTETIYNACFKHKDMFCFVDVLHRDMDSWNAFEIWDKMDPSSQIILTGSYQNCIMQKNNIKVNNFYTIIYTTIRDKEGIIDLSYDIISIKNQVDELHNNLKTRIDEIKKIAKQDTIPVISQGIQCLEPNKCDFYNYCNYSGNND